MPDKAAILIVDDRPEKLLALEAVLEDLGQTIVRAYSGREALRAVLARDFAVILLDVNMPDMDGFETASLIRRRKSSEHTPIIFITAFGDEMHAARGYSLGAVDYILAPVMPEVLRTKVAVFVDLYAKTEQVRRQAESLRRRATQLQKLAGASVAVNGALSVEAMLRRITDTARDIVGCHQAITLFLLRPAAGARPGRTLAFGSFSDRYADWRDRDLHLDPISTTLVAQSRTATRMTEAELRDHPDWEIVRHVDVPPVRGGMLAAPLTGRDGTNLGVIYLCDRYEGDFSNDDEAILVQLAQMASIALENSLFAEERETNRIKDEFLATLSHELRTPLNAILGWTQLLRMERTAPVAAPAAAPARGGANGRSNGAAGGAPGEDGDDPYDAAAAIGHGVTAPADEVAHALDVIERNARSQTKLIEDLLDVSRITTGKMRLSVQRIALGAAVRAAQDAVRPTLEAKSIEADFRADPAAAAAIVSGDPDRLQQVFWNLLTNAAKFTPAGGRITCRLELAPRDDARHDDAEGGPAPARDAVRFRVTDTGVGIEPQFLPYVFDRFRQADSSSTRQHGGLGIGLTIVRHIVELHGGTARADSGGEGRGSTFTISLPVAAAGVPAPADGPPPPPPHAVSSAPPSTGPAATPEPPPPHAPALQSAAIGAAVPDLTGLRILVIDDEPDARDLLRQILTRAGATAAIASSAAEALAALHSDPLPDLLVSDIAMPDEDGYALIRAVRALPPDAGGATPAVALTAYARDEDRQRCLAAGFQAHLAKPVDPDDLVRALAEWSVATRPADAAEPARAG